MATTPQAMVIGSFTFVLNPGSDTEWGYQMIKAEFNSPGAVEDIIQIMGFKSGKRTLKGVFFADSDFRSLETLYRAGQIVVCTDWLGNIFNALLTMFQPTGRINDTAHGFQTIEYELELTRRP